LVASPFRIPHLFAYILVVKNDKNCTLRGEKFNNPLLAEVGQRRVLWRLPVADGRILARLTSRKDL
jgi:hypothetical protein